MVLVCHKYRFIYLKTKKTASTSTEAFFERYCLDNMPDSVPQYRPEHIGPIGIIGSREGREERARAKWHAHMTAAEVLRRLGPRRWLSYFKFTTIRNPYAKCVSQFLYKHRNDPKVVGLPIEPRAAAFRAWLRRTGPRTDRSVYCIAGRQVVDDVIRFERLEEDVRRIARRLDLPAAEVPLPRYKDLQNLPKDHYSAYYDRESRDLVSRAYAAELKRFDYAFEDNTQRPDTVSADTGHRR